MVTLVHLASMSYRLLGYSHHCLTVLNLRVSPFLHRIARQTLPLRSNSYHDSHRIVPLFLQLLLIWPLGCLLIFEAQQLIAMMQVCRRSLALDFTLFQFFVFLLDIMVGYRLDSASLFLLHGGFDNFRFTCLRLRSHI